MASALYNMMVEEEENKPVSASRQLRTAKPSLKKKTETPKAEAKPTPPAEKPVETAPAETEQPRTMADVTKTIGAVDPATVQPPQLGIGQLSAEEITGTVAPTSEDDDIIRTFLKPYEKFRAPGNIAGVTKAATKTPAQSMMFEEAQRRIASYKPKTAMPGAATQPSESAPAYVGPGTRPAPVEAPDVSGSQFTKEGFAPDALEFFGRPFAAERQRPRTPKPDAGFSAFMASATPGSTVSPPEKMVSPFEPRVGDTAPKPSTEFTEIDPDVLRESFVGREMPTLTTVAQLKNSLQSQVSLQRAVRTIINQPQLDTGNPMYRVMRAYMDVVDNPNTTNDQRALAKDGLLGVAAYFDDAKKGKLNNDAFQQAVDLIQLSGKTDSTSKGAMTLSPALTAAMERDDVFGAKFGEGKEATERRAGIRFDTVYAGIKKSIQDTAMSVYQKRNVSQQPAAMAASEWARNALGPLFIDTQDSSALTWAESHPLRDRLASDIYTQVQPQFYGKPLTQAFNFAEMTQNSNVFARRFGGQFNLRSTLEQLTTPNYKGREREYVEAVAKANEFEAQGKMKEAAEAVADFYTTEALKLKYNVDDVEGYTSGRGVDVTTGASAGLRSAQRDFLVGEERKALIRGAETPRSGLTPTQLIGALLGEQGVDEGLFGFAAPRFAKPEVQTTGIDTSDAKTTNMKLAAHPNKTLTIVSASGKPMSTRERMELRILQEQLNRSSDPEKTLEAIKEQRGVTEGKKLIGDFEIGFTTTTTTAVEQDEFYDLRIGSRKIKRGDAASLDAVISDIKLYMRLPEGEDGVPFIDKQHEEMYEYAKKTRDDIAKNLDSYERQGEVYVKVGGDSKRGLPEQISIDQYQSLNLARQSLNELISTADQMRDNLGQSGITAGFKIKPDGSPDLTSPKPVGGKQRLNQTLALLDGYGQGVQGIDIRRFFEGINLEGKRDIVQMAPIDRNGNIIRDPLAKGLTKQYEVNPDGSVDVIVYEKVDTRVGKEIRSQYLPIKTEDGKLVTRKMSVGSVAETIGINTAASTATSRGRMGLSGDYIMKSFNQLHKEINDAIKLGDQYASSFAKYVMRNYDNEFIERLKTEGITKQELLATFKDMGRGQANALGFFIQQSSGMQPVPPPRAAGTMNATSQPRKTGSNVEERALESAERAGVMDVKDTVVRRNLTALQTSLNTARNIFNAEGAGADREATIERIVKLTLDRNSNPIDASVQPAFETAIRQYAEGLVDATDNRADVAFQFQDSLNDYAQEVVETAKANDEIVTSTAKGTTLGMAEGKGTAEDLAKRKQDIVVTAASKALKLIGYSSNSLAMRSLRASTVPATANIVAALDAFNKTTGNRSDTKKTFSDLVRAIADAELEGYGIPDKPTKEFSAPQGAYGALVQSAFETLPTAQRAKKKAELARQKRATAVIKRVVGSPTTETPTPIDTKTDTSRPTRIVGARGVGAKKQVEVVDPTMVDNEPKRGININRVDLGFGITARIPKKQSAQNDAISRKWLAFAAEVKQAIPNNLSADEKAALFLSLLQTARDPKVDHSKYWDMFEYVDENKRKGFTHRQGKPLDMDRLMKDMDPETIADMKRMAAKVAKAKGLSMPEVKAPAKQAPAKSTSNAKVRGKGSAAGATGITSLLTLLPGLDKILRGENK